jgi:hypothetical protein
MSIKADVQELESIRGEIKLLNDKKRKLKEKEREVENRITEYLRLNQHPGVKHQGRAIILEQKEKRANKKIVDRDMDAINVLRNHGIEAERAEKILTEVLEARKGEKIASDKLKIKKLDS